MSCSTYRPTSAVSGQTRCFICAFLAGEPRYEHEVLYGDATDAACRISQQLPHRTRICAGGGLGGPCVVGQPSAGAGAETNIEKWSASPFFLQVHDAFAGALIKATTDGELVTWLRLVVRDGAPWTGRISSCRRGCRRASTPSPAGPTTAPPGARRLDRVAVEIFTVA